MRENTGSAVGVAGIATFGYTVMAVVLAILVWISITTYAIVKWIAEASDPASPTTVLLLVIGNVTAYLVLVVGGMYLAGRGMRHQKRKKPDAEQLAIASPEHRP